MDPKAINTIYYLLNASNLLRSSTLRSYNFLKCCTRAVRENVKLPIQFHDTSKRCPKCLIDRNQNNTSYQIKPTRRDKFLEKISKKTKLTKFQHMYQNKSGGKNQNIMIINCGLCGHVVTKAMAKPERPVRVEEPPSHPKKKKRKDRFSGLNVSAVMSANKESMKKNSVDCNNGTNTNFKNKSSFAKETNDLTEKKKGEERQVISRRHEKVKKLDKSKLSNMLAAKTKTSRNLKAFLDGI